MLRKQILKKPKENIISFFPQTFFSPESAPSGAIFSADKFVSGFLDFKRINLKRIQTQYKITESSFTQDVVEAQEKFLVTKSSLFMLESQQSGVDICHNDSYLKHCSYLNNFLWQQ